MELQHELQLYIYELEIDLAFFEDDYIKALEYSKLYYQYKLSLKE